MFEQAVLPSHPLSRRYWSVALGLAGESALAGLLLISPLIWPQLLPRVQTMAWITAPAPPPAPIQNPPPVRVRPSTTPFQMPDGILYRPATIPPSAVKFDDPPGAGQDPGIVDGVAAGEVRGILDSLLREGTPPRLAAPTWTPPPVKAAPAEPPRRISALHPARLLYRVEPVYPPLARQARISGAVELTGVIGVDGRIRELRVLSGHPLLAAAALEAVRQWTYEPTALNGDPVEVAAPITVNFRLN